MTFDCQNPILKIYISNSFMLENIVVVKDPSIIRLTSVTICYIIIHYYLLHGEDTEKNHLFMKETIYVAH